MAWGADDSLLAGETDRGWGSRGNRTDGLERLSWNGRMPFEILEMSATRSGFRLRFTQPVDLKTARDPSSYSLESYTYLLHGTYGSPEVEKRRLEIGEVRVSGNARSAELVVEGLREGYVHELHADGLRSRRGLPLLHPEAYYTLIERPR